MKRSPLKWAGGKFSILPSILPHIGTPKTFVEPFMGSSTVSLNVEANKYILNDLNYDLINFFNHVIHNTDTFLAESSKYFEGMSKDKYLFLRDKFNQEAPDTLTRASIFIVMNKFAFNGLCRYNKKGVFNVPYCNTHTKGYPLKEIQNFVSFFKNKEVILSQLGFDDEALYVGLNEGDVVYFDPPYLPIDHFETSFTTYTKDGFSFQHHQNIVSIAEKLKSQGVVSLISNHDTEQTRNLYHKADERIVIPKQRLISAKSENRMKINEVLVVYKR